MIFENNYAYLREYQIDLNELIGEGQFGKVFACKSNNNNTIKYCAKIININEENEKFSLREKEIAEIIQSNKGNPNIVSIFHVEYLQKQGYIVIIMEKCDTNLKQFWNSKKKFNDSEIHNFLIQFLNGYSILFHNDIIHKDIKPENILIKNQDQQIIYKIADFGLAKICKFNQKDISRNGTLVYSAPEVNTQVNDIEVQQQLLGMKNLPHANSLIDIYSLGMILYQMIFGEYPFQLQEYKIINYLQKIKVEPFTITESNSKYKLLVEKMLQYYPSNRVTFQYLYFVFNQKFQTLTNNFQKFEFQKCNVQNNLTFNNKNDNQNQQFTFIPQQQQANKGIEQNNPQPTFQILPQQKNNIFPQQNIPFKPTFNQTIVNNMVKPYQQIKEFLNNLLCEFENVLNDSIKQIIKNINQSFINEFTIKQLQNYFPFQIHRIHNYDLNTLKFHYSLICVIRNPQCYQINISNIFEIKKDLMNFYQKNN